jgi:hypothetical protein
MAKIKKDAPMKTKTRPAPVPEPPIQRSIVGFKGTQEYQDWMKRLLRHSKSARQATNLTDLIDRAIVAYARQIGFDEDPPARY